MAIILSQLAKDASIVSSLKFILHVYRQANCSERFLRNSLREFCLTQLRHLLSFVVAYIEQVENIKKSKASVVEVLSCFATVKARIQ